MTEPTKTQRGTSTFQKPSIVINIGSGSTTDVSDEMRDIFKAAGVTSPAIYVVEPTELQACFETIKNDGTDLLTIYGGDGTCNAGAIVARNADIPLIALPGGTMNLLPKALYNTEDWKEALELALSQTSSRWQVAGNLNGKVFFCGAIMGDSTVMSKARESLRDGDVVDAFKHVPEIMAAIAHGNQFEFKADGEIFDRVSNTLHLACPYMSLGATLRDAFELASVPQLTLTQLFGIGATALASDWRSSPDILVKHAREIEISGEREFDVLLDGEPHRISCPIKIVLEAEGVRVLAPPHPPQTKA